MEWEEEQEEDDPCDLGGPGHYRGMLASDGEGPDCPCSRASLANWNVWVHGVQEGPPPHPTTPPSTHPVSLRLHLFLAGVSRPLSLVLLSSPF